MIKEGTLRKENRITEKKRKARKLENNEKKKSSRP